MKTDNSSYQAQSETISRGIATVFEPIKALEDLFAFVGRNSGSVIGNRYNWRTVYDVAGNHDVSSRTAVLDGIVHEIGDGIKDQIRIAYSEDRTIADDGEASTVLLGRGIVQFGDLADDLHQIDRTERFLPCLRFDLGNSREGGKYPQDGVQVRDRVTDQRLIVLADACPVIGLLQPSTHSRQGRPEVMRDVIAYLPDLAHQHFDAVQHQIEIL